MTFALDAGALTKVAAKLAEPAGEKLRDRIVINSDAAALRELAQLAGVKPVEVRDTLELIDGMSRDLAPGFGLLRAAEKATATGVTVSSRDLLLGGASSGRLTNLAAINGAKLAGDALTLSSDELRSLVQRLDGSAIERGDPNMFAGGAPSGWRELPRWARSAVKLAHEDHLAWQLIGSYTPSAGDEDVKAARTAANALKKVLDAPTAANREMVDQLLRSTSNFVRNTQAFMEERTGRIAICERQDPLPPAIASGIDQRATLAMLHALVKQQVPNPIHDAGLASLAKKIPTDLVRVLDAAKMSRIVITRSNYNFSREARMLAIGANMVGLYLVAKGAELALAAAGIGGLGVDACLTIAEIGGAIALARMPTVHHPLVDFVARFREGKGNMGQVVVGEDSLEVGPTGAPRADETEGVVGHEMFHVLDFCLARHGSLSDEPEFVEIWEATNAARERGDLIPDFPSLYAATNTKEFFAEAACSYLDIARPTSARHANRAELKERNPALYAYFERLFSVRLPKAIAEGDVQPFARTLISDGSMKEALAKPEATRDASDWLLVASSSMQRAELEQDLAPLASAQEALERAAKLNSSGWLSFSATRRMTARRCARTIKAATERLASVRAEIEARSKAA